MRIITDHKINPANDKIVITVTDEPGAGGANHRYELSGFDPTSNPSYTDHHPHAGDVILFQNGPIAEAGVNGVTQEVLLAIVIDRLRSFQAGAYACRENGRALILLEDALRVLHNRTLARMQRGVEGTHTV